MHWWGAVATITRLVGDLDVAEDAVQDACTAALRQWPTQGVPENPGGWLVSVARHKALDRLRREGKRHEKETVAMRELGDPPPLDTTAGRDDDISLIFMCCHPSLDPGTRVALTLRAVSGLSTAEVAAALLVPEPTMAKRLTRAKAKIRDAAIPFRPPRPDQLVDRLPAVLRVVYLVFTEGHTATRGDLLVRGTLCDTAIELARALAALLPDEPEVSGLLSLLLLTDARRAARTDQHGELILLEDQDRALWNHAIIDEGDAILLRALRAGRPGPYQLQAAIAGCHSTERRAQDTDWRQISILYDELMRYEPSAVFAANKAVAVAMTDGPSAGLVILDAVGHHPQLDRWPQLHIARAALLHQLDRKPEAIDAYRRALELEPAQPERNFIHKRLQELDSD